MSTICVTWETAHRHGEAWISHHRLRYRMFIERQRWTVPNYKDLEYDQFDTPAAAYIISVDQHQRARGSARLIPTTRPYMVESLWANLVDSELPHCESIWEASRFGCERALDAMTRRQVVAELILGCQEFGIANGISKYLGVMPIRIFTHVIAAHGCPVTLLGAPRQLHGHQVAAAYVDVSPSTLAVVRSHTSILHAVLDPPLSLVA
jgi:N-acyl-L-homoserine lactone synthetase